jgi:hypothetical protein
MWLALCRGLGVLCVGLLLAGCDSEDNGPVNEQLPTPVWAEGNPSRGNDNNPRLRATTEPGSTLHVFSKSGCRDAPVLEVLVDESRLAEFSPSVADDSKNSFSLATFRDGARSPCSQPHAYTEDSQPPKVSWVGLSPRTDNDNDINLSASVDSMSQVVLHASGDCQGKELGTAATTEYSTQVSFTVRVLENTTNHFSLLVKDSVGNTACSTPYTYIEDSLPPQEPRWSPDNPVTGNFNELSLRVTVEAGSKVTLFENDDCGWSGTRKDLGKVTASELVIPMLVQENSRNFFTVESVDAAGNSFCSKPYTFTEDSVAPAAPLWSTLTPRTSTRNDPTLVVAAEADARVEFFSSGDCTGPALGTVTSVALGQSGQASLQVMVADDRPTSFTTRATDKAGNRGACSAVHPFAVDRVAPAQPVLRGVYPSPGQSSTFVFATTTEPGSTVSVYKMAGCQGSVAASISADSGGTASFSLAASFNTSTTVSAQVRDPAGNLSPCSDALVYVHDSVAPGFVGFLFSPASPANHNAPVLQGTTEPGARVLLFTGNACAGDPFATPPVSATGSFEVTLSVADDSTTAYSAYAIDVAGNLGKCSSTSYVEDSTAPASPSALVLAPTSPGTSNTVTVTGSSVAAAQVLLFTSEGCTGAPVKTVTPSSGSFSVSTTVPDNATTSLFVAARDAAGNLSQCAGPLVYVEDSQPPETGGVKVSDGAMEDVSYQLVADVAEVHWEGFTDTNGVVLYEHLLTTNTRCDSSLSDTRRTTTQTSARLTGLSLSEGSLYFHCVRAKDAAGNWSPFLASNGFRVDLSPPFVSATEPTNGAERSEVVAPLRFFFNEPVEVSSVTSDLFTLEAGGRRLATTVACAGSSCTFTPSRPLPYGETVRATLAASVKDLAGRVMKSPVTLGFTTRGRTWQPPRELHVVRPGLTPDVAVDGQGSALAVWVQGTDSGAFRPFTSRSTPHLGWEPARELDTVHPGDVQRPAVAVNEAGFGVAVWELHEGGRVDLYVTEYTPGSGWSAPHPLETRAEPVSTPRVEVDAQGNALVVWRQSDGTAESVWAARLVKDGGWSAPLLLELEAGAATVPALALESSGRALAAWLQPDAAGTMRVRASRFVPGSGWTSPEQAAAFGAGPSVSAALSADGSAFILFREASPEGGFSSLHATRFVPGAGWSATTTKLGTAPPASEEPSLALDRWGRAMAAWTTLSSSTSRMFLARFSLEDGWRPVSLTEGEARQPSVAADGQGNFHVLWVETVFTQARVYRARFAEGSIGPGFLGALEPEHDGIPKRPRVRANAAGGAVAVWYRDNGGGFSSNLVYAASYE